MSKTTILNNISRLQKELADISKKIAQESKKENDNNKRIIQINNSISKNISQSFLKSKLNEVQRKQNEIVRIQSKIAELKKKEADKVVLLNRYKDQLSKEEEKERKRYEEAEKKRQKEQVEFQKQINRELALQRTFVLDIKNNSKYKTKPIYDIFISHASEDKDDFVRPLAIELEKLGVNVWFDEFTLKVGDSLRKSIDKGLTNSKFGAVVLSFNFFQKKWTEYELNSLVAKEMEGNKVILPIWHKVTKTEVLEFSPALADKVALNSSINTIKEIAQQLFEVVME